MFTNFLFRLTKRIIADHYAVVAEETSFTMELLLDLVEFQKLILVKKW